MINFKTSATFIVDDDPFVGQLYKKHLGNLGYRDLHYFNSGVACLNHLHLNPALILLDHQMSQVTGFEVLKKIKRFNPDAVVIMVSGQEDMATALNALKYGAFDYIIKDNTETLRIESALERLTKLQAQRPAGKSIFKKFLSKG